jgi:hypothetical protein
MTHTRISPPLSILFLISVVLWGNCTFLNKEQNQDKNASLSALPIRLLKEIVLMDNGPVVPMPTIRRICFTVQDTTQIGIRYIQTEWNSSPSTAKNYEAIGETREDIWDEMEKVADLATDGIDIKPGKIPCLGMNSLDIMVIYNSGDTNRFAITGGARCDRALAPSVWKLDSMARLLEQRAN